MDWIGIAAIITALGIAPVLLVWTNHLIKRSDKRAEEREKRQEYRSDVERARLSSSLSELYGYLWKLMHVIDADRIFIMQPHPLHDKQFISISIEVVHPDRDVVRHKDNFQCRRMSDWPGLIAKIGNEDWMIYRSLSEIKDPKIHTEAYRRGVRAMYFRRMSDAAGNWIGTLCVEYTHSNPDKIDFIKGEMAKNATLIADILPEYKPIKDI